MYEIVECRRGSKMSEFTYIQGCVTKCTKSWSEGEVQRWLSLHTSRGVLLNVRNSGVKEGDEDG